MLYNFLLTFIRFIFRLINGREVVQGLENLPKDQPYIIAATHRSLTDPLFVAFETYPHQIAFMAKESLFKFKPLGWLFRKVNVFPVNRDKPSTSTIKHAVKIPALVIPLRLRAGQPSSKNSASKPSCLVPSNHLSASSNSSCVVAVKSLLALQFLTKKVSSTTRTS